MLKSTARDFLENESPTSTVRELEKSTTGYSSEHWGKMADLGWLGLGFSSAYGGADGDLIDQTALFEEIGRAILPGPAFISTVLCSQILLNAANEDQKQRLLPQIAQGNLILTLALAESGGWISGVPEDVKVVSSKDDLIVTGTKLFVPYASIADFLLVAAKSDNGMTLVLIDPNSPGITITPLESTAEYKQFQVDFRETRIPNENIIGQINNGSEPLNKALQRATIVQCAEMVGRIEKVLEMTVDYANFRTAFGRPIAAFQAIQHHCANLKVAVDGARVATQQAAWLLNENLPATEQISIAKAFTGDASRLSIEVSHAVFAGISFTVEHDIQLYTMRSKIAEAHLGDTDYHLEELSKTM